MKPSIHERPRRERGNAMIEFAFSAGVLIPLFIGTFQFGYGFYIYNMLSTQMRAGARYASLKTFACASSSEIDTFKTAVKNVIMYGNSAGTGSLIEPGLTASQIDVEIKDSSGNNADSTHTPSYVSVSTVNYSVDVVVTSLNFNGKPYVRFPYLGRYAPAE
jgi:Flp pilus assembly protein TadG